MTLKKIVIVLSLILWPLGLFLANKPLDFLSYALPSSLLALCYFLYIKGRRNLSFLSILAIPFVEPKLALFPLLFVAGVFIWKKERARVFVLLALSLITLLVNWKGFRGQTIFTPDYEARQEVIRNTQLYPSIFLARLFHNKARIYLNKFDDNFFALIDPNNYFFGFHPREIQVANQNLDKFPFLGIPFFLYGLFRLSKKKNWELTAILFVSGLLALSVLSSFDRNDFILWVPLGLILVHGVNEFNFSFRKRALYYLVFSLAAIIQIARLLVIKL